MKSETLSLKTIINELVFLSKTVIIQWIASMKHLKKKIVACKQISRKIPDHRNFKKHYHI